MSARKSAPGEIRRGRRQRGHSCWDHLVVAPLWVAFQANLGTLLRTCDAVGACIAVPNTSHYRAALKHGDTLGPRRRPCIHWVTVNKDRWIAQQRQAGWQIVVVELAEGAVALLRLEPAKQRTVVLLGHGAALDAEIKRQKPSRLQTELEFRRRAASAARPLFIGTPARHEHEEILRIWRAGDRVREERAGGPSDGAYGVIVGDLWWYWDPRYGASSNEENPKAASRTGIGREPAVMLNPIVMLSELRFAVAGRSEVAGRPTITAEATPRAFDQRVFRTRVGLSFELQELGRGAERYILEVDTQTGVLLEAVALFNGEPFHKVTILDVAFDHPIPDECFCFQPPSSVRNPTIGGLPAPQYLSLPEAQRRTPFTVLVPDQLPGDWHVHCTYFERAEGRWAPHVSVQYGSADGHEDISLWQCPANERPSVEQVTSGRRWEEVVRDGLVVRVTNVASRQGPKAVAHVERDDTFVVLASSKLTSEQLATIAAGLKPA